MERNGSNYSNDSEQQDRAFRRGNERKREREKKKKTDVKRTDKKI